jgi:hypothetical protein
MTKEELVLNIAVNLSRIGRFVGLGNTKRVDQFLEENRNFLNQLESQNLSPRFQKTLELFRKRSAIIEKKDPHVSSEEAYTWANILTHRAKLA